tara:strand:+ start:3916 stop:4875 length:960 start_codon:yes stop_codon:yes gene_type:complete
MIHIIHGSDPFRIQDRVRQLCAQHPNAQWIDLTEKTSINEFMATCNQHSLFNPHCFIRYKNPSFLTQKTTDSLADLLNCLSTIQASAAHTLVVYTTKPIDKRFKTAKQCLSLAQDEQINAFTDWEQGKVIRWIGERIRYYGLTADTTVASAIWQVHHCDLYHTDQLIQTVHAYLGTATHINRQTLTDMHAFPTQSMIDAHEALKTNRPTQLLRAVMHLLNDKQDPVYIITSLANQCRRHIQIMSDRSASPATLSKQLGANPYFIEQLQKSLTSSHTMESLTRQYKRLIAADFMLKSGSHDSQVALLIAVQPLPSKKPMQ